jgi:hypothetical protein
MLQVYAEGYLVIGGAIANVERIFAYRDAFPESGLAATELTSADLTAVTATISVLAKTCRELNLPVSTVLLHGRASDPPRTGREMALLIQAVFAELKGQLFLYVPSHLSPHYGNENCLSEAARLAFPSAYQELKDSGSCIACGMWTAAVFHAMRAAEIGV